MSDNEQIVEVNQNTINIGVPAASSTIDNDNLQWERDLLRRERELLERERQVLLRTNHSSEFDATQFHPSVERTLPEFDPGSLTGLTAVQWVKKVESLANIYRWDRPTLLCYAVGKLKGAANFWLQGIEGEINDWESFKAKLLKGFPSYVDDADIHFRLSTKKKKQSDSYESFIYEMKAIASRGSISNQALLKYIINGIDDKELAKLLAVQQFADAHELLTRIMQYEATFRGNKKKDNTVPNQTVPNTNKTVLNPIKCFNCGEEGHKSLNCKNKHKGAKCFACNEYGHKSTECPKKNKQNTNNNAQSVLLTETKINGSCNKQVTVQNVKMNALIDTGSAVNLIKNECFLKISVSRLQAPTAVLFGAGNHQLDTLGKFEAHVDIDDSSFYTIIHVVPDHVIPIDVVIGNELLDNAELIKTREIFKIRKLQDQLMLIDVCEKELDIGNRKFCEEINSLVKAYNPQNRKQTEIETRLILTDEIPVYQTPRRLPIKERNEVEKQVTTWLEEKIIQPSCSDFASPVVPVKKKDGSTRVCIDYRKLNRKIIKDRYPLPNIDDQLDKLRDAKIFSTLDLKNGFFHIPVAVESRKYTSFITHCGQYEFLKTPFGLCNSPAVFQRFINHIFKDLIVTNVVLAYMDDLIIPAIDYKEALDRLKTVLDRAEEYNLQLSWKKCKFLKDRISYLGYVITNNTKLPSEEKTKAVVNYPRPESIAQIQSFLGLTGYFRKFIADYSIIAKPLSDLLKKNSKFVFGEQQEAAFELLKRKLSDGPVLQIFSYEAETELHTDASKEGYGAVLLQRNPEDKLLHPVYYMSRKTTDAEKNYCSYELEILAVIEALKKFRVYLLGIRFKIMTDCAAFQLTMNKKDLSTRVARWILLLEEFDYTVEHRPGVRMKHADALSRNPVVMVIQDGLINALRAAQERDESVKAILKILQNQEYEDYVTQNGLLYKEINGNLQLVIPVKMQNEIIRRAHEPGHFAVRKTSDLIGRDYYIPNLEQRIKRYIISCIPCILSERKAGKKEGYLNPIEKGDVPLETYHIDHLGPLATTKKQYNHIFVVIDAFTKFVWLYPTKTVTSRETLEKLESQSMVFGHPKRIISDRGTAFTAGEFAEYCEQNHIQHVKITTGVPRGNGQVERMMRIITPVLAKLSVNSPTEWFKNVDKVQQAMNSSYQRSIAMTPFELLTGVKMRTPEQLEIMQCIEEETRVLFEQERDTLRERAKEQILKVQEENKKTYNKRRKKARRYRIGDVIAIKRTQGGGGLKLRPKFLGPYKVTKVSPCDRYEVQRIGEGQGSSKTTVSADNIKIWGDTASTEEESESPSETDDV